ncbi:MAG: hypothetical protein KAV83_02560 [Desulfobacterales bacterium]|nr:hypothetical protein [Desulfobacterales bacterium]
MKAIYDKLRASLERQFSLCELVSDEDFQKQIVSFLMFISENEYLQGYVKNLVSDPIHYENKLQALKKETNRALGPVRKRVLQDIENLDNGDKKIRDFAKNSGHLWLKGVKDCKKIKASLEHYNLIVDLIAKVLLKEPAGYISPQKQKLIEECRAIKGKYDLLYSVSAREAFVILSAFTVGHLDPETFGLPEDAEISRRIKDEISRNLAEAIGSQKNVSGTQEEQKIRIGLIRKKRHSVSIALKRLYYYLLDQLDTQLLNYQILKRYKTRCEWYSRNRMQDVIEEKEKKVKKGEKKDMRIEDRLWPDMAEFLFAEGLYPTYVRMGNQIPDFAYLASPDPNIRIEPLVVECKVLQEKISQKSHVTRKCKKGLNQIIEAMGRSNQDVGYLVMYNLTEKVIKFPTDLFYNNKNKKIFIIDIDISETPPSKKKGKAIIIEQSDLLSKGSR